MRARFEVEVYRRERVRFRGLALLRLLLVVLVLGYVVGFVADFFYLEALAVAAVALGGELCSFFTFYRSFSTDSLALRLVPAITPTAFLLAYSKLFKSSSICVEILGFDGTAIGRMRPTLIFFFFCELVGVGGTVTLAGMGSLNSSTKGVVNLLLLRSGAAGCSSKIHFFS